MGYAFASIGALSLQHFNILPFDQFMWWCGLFFVIATVLVGIFKAEKPVAKDEQIETLSDVYKQVGLMLKVKALRRMFFVLVLWKLPFCLENMALLNIQSSAFSNRGVPKEHIAYLGGITSIVSVFIPALVGNWAGGSKPLTVCLYFFFPRMLLGLIGCFLVYYRPTLPTNTSNTASLDSSSILDQVPLLFYSALMISSLILGFLSTAMFCGTMGFFARVAPKDIGGTYLTALNMSANLGGMWPAPLVYWLVDEISTAPDPVNNPNVKNEDGYYLLSGILAILGCLGLPALWAEINALQNLPRSAWAIRCTNSAKTP